VKTETFTFKLSPTERRILESLATNEGETLSVAVRRAVKEAALRRGLEDSKQVGILNKDAVRVSEATGMFA